MLLLPLWLSLSAAAQPADSLQAMHQALLTRHQPPSCEHLESLSDTPTETLLRVVHEVSAPAWAPMRAAECLTRRHHLQIEEELRRWVVEPELKGLGLLVIGLLPELPEPTALQLAQLALDEGPAPDRVRRTLRRADRPALRALGHTSPPEVP